MFIPAKFSTLFYVFPQDPEAPDERYIEVDDDVENCYYQGYVEGEESSTNVVASTCNGLKGVIRNDEVSHFNSQFSIRNVVYF